MYKLTTATRRIAAMRARIRAIAGGTSAGKTISILQILIDAAQRDTTPTITSVVSESMPHLRKGAMRDFLHIMEVHKYYNPERWNKTDSVYTFETGSKIEFFSCDQAGKVRGPRRDRLYINEANNIAYETFDQLEVRTKDTIWLDWNPTSEFWYYTELQHKRTNLEEITLTYKDNEALDHQIVASIESRKNNANWWRVYGLGLLGAIESRIYTDWAIIPEVPHEAKLDRYVLDFGYTNDPSALLAQYIYNGGYIFDELLYKRKQDNQMLGNFLLAQPPGLIVADSAEPKSIAELQAHGLTVIGSKKGPDSVRYGTQYVQEQRISLTARSTNTIKEYRNYLWITDANDKITNEPQGYDDHSMSAIRYGITSKYPDYKERMKPAAWGTGAYILESLERQDDPHSYYS